MGGVPESEALFRLGWKGFILAWAAALLAAAWLSVTDAEVFQRFLGPVNPMLVFLLAGPVGAAALAALYRMGWPAKDAAGHVRGRIFWIVVFASAFALPTILVDVVQPFGPSINIALPSAAAFYPAIAFLVEVVFHLAPLALAVAVAHALPGHGRQWSGFWPAAIPVALLEPAYQVTAGFEGEMGWRDLYVALHLFAFSLVQLGLFRRFGFGAMLTFRLVYYLLWHIVWGTLRLPLFF